MNRPYSWTRTLALLGELWNALTSPWRYCRAIDWSVVPKAYCVKDKGHQGPHVDIDGHSWASTDDRPITGGHMVVPFDRGRR